MADVRDCGPDYRGYSRVLCGSDAEEVDDLVSFLLFFILFWLVGGGLVRGAGLEPAKALATRCLTRGWDLKTRPFDQPRVPPLLGIGGVVGVFIYGCGVSVCWRWARSAVWIARRPPKPEVVGSNPTGPAIL